LSIVGLSLDRSVARMDVFFGIEAFQDMLPNSGDWVPVSWTAEV
jgi:hypothetical protein